MLPALPHLTLFMLLWSAASSEAHSVLKHTRRDLQQSRSSTQATRQPSSSSFQPCGTVSLPPNDPTMKALVRNMHEVSAASSNFSAVVPVVFHVIHDGNRGKISAARLNAQLDVINRDFAGSGFSFQLLNTTYTDNAAWFRYNDSHLQDLPIKRALRVGGADVLNTYTLYTQGLGGFAYYPFATMNQPIATMNNSTKERLTLDGIFLHYGTLPGGFVNDLNLGRMLTHEIGHWLALYHPFDNGGCVQGNRGGDFISDTPAERAANYPRHGCNTTKDSCSAARFPGFDPVTNHMDYSADSCKTSFTPMQIARMRMAWTSYRAPLV